MFVNVMFHLIVSRQSIATEDTLESLSISKRIVDILKWVKAFLVAGLFHEISIGICFYNQLANFLIHLPVCYRHNSLCT